MTMESIKICHFKTLRVGCFEVLIKNLLLISSNVEIVFCIDIWFDRCVEIQVENTAENDFKTSPRLTAPH